MHITLLALSGILYGTITAGGAWFSREGYGLFETSMYPYVVSSLCLLPFALRDWRSLIHGRMLRFHAVAGLVNALLTLSHVGSVLLGVNLAIVALLLYTEPIWTTIFGRLFLRESITKRQVCAVGLAIVGVLFLVVPDLGPGGAGGGIVCGLMAGLFLSLWIVWDRSYERNETRVAAPVFGMTAWTILWMLTLRPLVGLLPGAAETVHLTPRMILEDWPVLLLFTLFADILPNQCFFRGIQRVQASVAGVVLLLEPISAITLAWLFFREPVTAPILAGAAFILAANAVAMKLSVRTFVRTVRGMHAPLPPTLTPAEETVTVAS